MDRKELDYYFIDIAVLASSRSTCLKRQHGAIIVKDKQVLSIGYNASPIGLPHCEECSAKEVYTEQGIEFLNCRSIHAPLNAIIFAARHGINIKDADMYITGIPCPLCARVIVNAGIKTVCYAFDEEEQQVKSSLEILEKAGIKVKRVD